MVDVDDDDLGMGPVIVRRPVHEAAEQLRRETQPYGATLEAAAERERRSATAGDNPQAAFWHEVSDFLQWQAAVAAHVQIIILEDGEIWDREAGTVRRIDTRQPRSDKAN